MLPAIRRRSGSYFPTLFEDWSSLLDNFARAADAAYEGGSDLRAIPTELFEYPDKYLVRMDVPGIEKKDIDISLEDNTLTVKVLRKEQEEQKDVRMLHSGRWYGTAARTFTLPLASGDTEVGATLASGVLSIEIKKQPEKQVKKIAIN